MAQEAKFVTTSKIIENRQIAADVFSMTLESAKVAKNVKTGQFINVYLDDKSMLLPRPISICSIKGDRFTLVYKIVGKGTAQLAEYKKGDTVKVSSGLGNGFQLDSMIDELNDKQTEKDRTIALVGGGMGIAPLVSLAEAIKDILKKGSKSKTENKVNNGVNIIAIIGFQDEPFLVDELKNICDEVYIATETGSKGFKGNVLELIEDKGIKADYYLACGPKPMLRALARHCENNEKTLQVSMEERMGCGFGACVGCACKVKQIGENGVEIITKKVCKDGPVFFGSEVVWNE